MPLQDLWPTWRDTWILHEDADLLIVDKPAGVPTHAPDQGRVDDAHTRLLEWLRTRGEAEPYLGIHQRLDRDTSGVLLFTRRREANKAIADQFEGRRVEKTYAACVTGLRGGGGKERREVMLRHRLVADKGGLMRALPASARGGQEAVAKLTILERAADRALVELRPETGRTHQLRVQLAAEGMPIAGDEQYGGAAARRLLLHATELSLKHPATGKRMTFRSAAPDLFRGWLRGEGELGSFEPAAIEALLREAAGRRYGIARLPGTDAFRIFNGGGDGLTGVAVDVYGEHLVVSISGEEPERAREAILDAAARLGAAGVYVKVRPKHASVVVDTRRADFAPAQAVRGESAPESFTIHELGLPFEVRLGDGLSTGIFLDQRENRRRVRELSEGKRVLNLFAYTGAFSVAAAVGGARATVTVDVSRSVLAWAKRNLDAVGASPEAHTQVEADALRWLKQAGQAGDRFDLVVLDPPSFATTKKTRFSAESDYRALAALALGVLAPGGRLLACTNHRGIVRAKLRRYLHEAAREAGREVAQMRDMPDPADFPPEPGLESSMKSVLVTLAGKDPR